MRKLKKKPADALCACNVHFEISTQRRKVFNIPFVESWSLYIDLHWVL